MLQKSENFRKLFADALEKEEFRKVCLREDVFPVDLKAFNYLIKICLKKKIKLYYIDRVKMNNFDLLKVGELKITPLICYEIIRYSPVNWISPLDLQHFYHNTMRDTVFKEIFPFTHVALRFIPIQ